MKILAEEIERKIQLYNIHPWAWVVSEFHKKITIKSSLRGTIVYLFHEDGDEESGFYDYYYPDVFWKRTVFETSDIYYPKR